MIVPRFALRPRRAWAVWLILPFGAALVLLPLVYGVHGTPRLIDMVAGAGVIAMTLLFLGSPTWRSYVQVSEQGLAIAGPRGERLRLDWQEVVEVLIDEEEHAALVRGPSGRRSFLLPSPAHPAPYRIAQARALYEAIVATVPKDKLRKTKVFA